MPAKSHGRSYDSIYRIWQLMVKRCCDASSDNYPNYGGRGIRVCDRWYDSFEAFLDDMGERPEGKQIDRIDNDGDYEPGNCRWATPKQQSRNKRTNCLLTFNGETKTVAEWAETQNLKRETILSRLAHGMPVERALTLRPEAHKAAMEAMRKSRERVYAGV